MFARMRHFYTRMGGDFNLRVLMDVFAISLSLSLINSS
ncbi:hypothetical protein HAL013_14890 [Helicobacter ailurogastricus]|uniref:Uncharacterized protein n=1 Tax=Helicobacter ailurogastricus TaxID=1578720 RepID=A0A0K2XCG9_9HELI|nr:hypothetical protein HAL011_13510 [Helicobacter ailurogastricus]CRF43263.1 hypothetical protein HAL013_14890 [Helicobacter ailurogastricus]CRF44935.1 hypothetical protein HAL09_15610 [Helicobacter ailurogastricus]